MARLVLASALLIGVWALGPRHADATVLVEVPLADMTADADAIVLGDVVRVQTRMVMLQGAFQPWTVTELRVDRWLKGSGGRTVQIHERGGIWNGGGMRIAGTPEYAVGERVVAFLHRDPLGQLRTYGMVQGRFVVRAGVDVPAVVERDLHDVGFASWSSQGMEIGHRDAAAMPLRELLDRIGQVLTWVRDFEAGTVDNTELGR